MDTEKQETPAVKRRMSTEERRRCILDAALKLFSRRGYHGTTTRALAREVGVNEAILYRHFQSKEVILLALLSESQGRIDPYGLRAAVENLPPREAVVELLRFVAEFTRKFKDHNAILFSQIRNSDEAREVFRAMIEERVRVLFPLFKQWREAGVVREIEHAALFRIVIGTFVMFHHTAPIMSGTDLDISLDSMINALQTLILKDSPAAGEAIR